MAKDLSQYPVTFGYGAQDGVYYGPNGSIGLRHRGNDRACPNGTPIIIAGKVIGLTGSTGITSGSHCHTQASTANANWSNDIDPGPYEFKPGLVVGAGWHNQFGNYIMVRVGNVDITYAHLSRIDVSIGQVLNEGMELTPSQQDKLFKMMKRADPTAEELNNPEYRKNPGLAIDTGWNTWGKYNYEEDKKPKEYVFVGIIDNRRIYRKKEE